MRSREYGKHDVQACLFKNYFHNFILYSVLKLINPSSVRMADRWKDKSRLMCPYLLDTRKMESLIPK